MQADETNPTRQMRRKANREISRSQSTAWNTVAADARTIGELPKWQQRELRHDHARRMAGRLLTQNKLQEAARRMRQADRIREKRDARSSAQAAT